MNNKLFMNDTFDNFTFTQSEQVVSSTENSQEVLFDDTCFLTESYNAKNEDVNVFSEDFFSNTLQPEGKEENVLQEDVNLDTSVQDSVKSNYKISQSIADYLSNEFFTNTFQSDETVIIKKNDTRSLNLQDFNASTEDFFSDTFTEDIVTNEKLTLNTSNPQENKFNDNDVLVEKLCDNNNENMNLSKINNKLILDKDNLKNNDVNIQNKEIYTNTIISLERQNEVKYCSKIDQGISHTNNSSQLNFNAKPPTHILEDKKNTGENNFTNKQKIDLIENTKENEKDVASETLKSSTIDNNNLVNEETCKLLSWGLPEAVLDKYKSRNVIKMFPWQVECLSNTKVMNECANLVYSAPTSAGKTLVAEILAIKTIFERKKKVIFILPFVSIVREKMYYFQDILGSSGIRVEGFMGSYNPPGGFQTVQVAICTIEKANSLINRLLEEGKLSDIGAILVDEVHLLGDPSRGYLLELLLTKLRYISIRDENVNVQIIGMSATLPNLEHLAKWLNAELYTTTFRPIPLLELAHVCGEIYDNNLKLIRKLQPMPDIGTDTDNILQLCLETIQDSCSVLIFCPTKNWCENLSQQISLAFFKIGSSKTELGAMLRTQLKTNLILELLEQLKYCPAGLDEVLKKTVSFGVAFHHAGLTMDERDIIEGAFRNGGIRILVATSTLSSGVNLPARRVIIRTPNFHGKPIDTLSYRQMIGRAGRMGKDDKGESILICQKNDYLVAKQLMSAQLQPVESCLEGAGKLKRAILEVIASGVATTPEDVALFTSCTLLAVTDTKDEENLENPIEEAVNFLSTNEFIRLVQGEDDNSKYVPTSLGKACLSSSMAPDEGLALFSELEKARQCFVLETELHLIYLVTPYSACNAWGNIDWMFYLQLWERIPSSMKRVGELVGVRDSFLVSATRGKIQTNTNKLYHKLLVHKRFFVALALQDLVNEKSLGEVCAKFNCNRGMLQSLQQSASSFAGMVTAFSKQLGWSSVEILISQFQDRLQFGVSRDLLDLMRLSVLNGKMARILYNSGIETVSQLANSNVLAIENILHKVMPFESDKEREGESEFDMKQRKKVRNVWVTGKEGLTVREAGEMLIRDARNYLKIEMGLAEAKWEVSQSKENENLVTNTEKSAILKEGSKENIPPPEEVVVEVVDSEHTNKKDSTFISSSIQNSSEETDDFSISNCSSNSVKNEETENNILQINHIELESNISNHLDNDPGSDQSMFSEEFTLQLSDDNTSLCSPSTINIKDCSEVVPSDLTPVTQNNSQINLNISDDILMSSFNEELDKSVPGTSKKRPRNSGDSIPETSKKKKKTSKSKVKKTTQELSLKVAFEEEQNKEETECSTDFSKFDIVDVCAHEQLFERFSEEILEKTCFSLSLGCSRIEEEIQKVGFISAATSNKTAQEKSFSFKNRKANGISISWGQATVYYISLENSLKERAIKLLKKVVVKDTNKIKLFDCKEQIKCLKYCCDLDILSNIEDPKIGDWILEPEGKEKNLQALTLVYCPEAVPLVQLSGSCRGVGSVSLDLTTTINSRLRSSVESLVTWYVVDAVKTKLYEENPNFLDIYDVEMKSCLSLSKMEIHGMGISKVKMQLLADELRMQMESIETNCYSLAGRRFSLSSPAEVAKVLGMFRGKKVSTRKEILEKSENPLADYILQWRKTSTTMTKMIYPLIRSIENDRLRGCYLTHTATGRISMHEPNLQTVAKDFEVVNPHTKECKTISCRNAFTAADNYTLVSADYCQLELRLLAHLSQDRVLCDIMKRPGDVFKSIAGKWNNVDESMVDDKMRQNAKHICYGIIYGMGCTTLADQLKLSEDEATQFMATFKNTYPGIQVYIQKTIESCKSNGFVETITGRRRYLKHIRETDSTVRGQAERQAINTTVQGSAADMAKKAMVMIDEKLQETFCKSKLKPKLIMHLHDELIYEVPSKFVKKVAKVMRKCMENAVHLSVPFPVKLKTGQSWGELTEYQL